MPATPYTPGRDRRFPYASAAIEHIEARCCALGCVRAGSPADIAAHGAGGTCPVLAAIFFETEPIPEITDDGESLTCQVREDPAVAAMEPLFPAPNPGGTS